MPSELSNHALNGQFLTTMVIMLVTGGLLAFVFHRLKLPSFLAFILTGVLLGPDVLNLIQAEQVQLFAQVGVIFLLFVVGLDLSVGKLKQLRHHAPLAGLLQLGISTLLLTAALAWLAHLPTQLAFLLGSILSLSSTAIVLKTLEDEREHDTDYGRLILGILIIQDLSIVPLMTLLPALLQPLSDQNLALNLLMVIGKALFFAAITVVVSIRLVPVFLDRLASTNQKEVFTLALVSVGIGMALITHELGLSYEAGAFSAGLALSGSVFCRQVIADSKGFRDVFMTLFFVSMGLLFNLRYLEEHLLLVLGTTLILILLKWLAAWAAAILLRLPRRTAIWCGFALFQVGEFSFVLLSRTLDTVRQVPIWEPALALWSPVLIDAIIITMFLTPLAIRATPNLIKRFSGWRLDVSAQERTVVTSSSIKKRVIIAGYGPTAQNLVDALTQKHIPYIIVEVNLGSIKKLKKKGIPCLYGDIARPEILEAAGVKESNVLALTFPDIRTAETAVQHAKQLNPELVCLVRSRYRVDIGRLYEMGVDDVIHEEFETSVSFIFHIMNRLDYPIVETERLIAMVRDQERATFGENFGFEQPVFGRFSLLEGTKLEWLELLPGSPMVGQTLAESQIRAQTGVNVIAVISAVDKNQVAPDPELVLSEHDVLVVVGALEQLHALENLVSNG